MAEIINLASFNLDTNRLQNSLSELQDTYLDLKKEQKSYTDQVKETAKQITLLEKANEALADSAGDNTEAIEENRKEIEALLKAQRDAQKAELNLATSISRVRTEITQTTTQLTAYQNAEGRTTSLIELGNKALLRQINNRNDARASSQELNRIVSQLNPNIEEEAQLMQRLNARIDENTEFVRANSSATTQQAMNIGRYTESILDAYRAMEQEKQALEETRLALMQTLEATEEGTDAYNLYAQQINVLNVQINNIGDSMAEARGETEGLAEGFNPLGGAIGNFVTQANQAGGASTLFTNTFAALRAGILGALQAGLAFIATPIGAVIAALAVAVGLVVGAFKLAKESLTSTEEGTQRLAIVTGAITGIFKGLFKVVKPLGLFFADVFIKVLENVGKVAEATLNTIAEVLDFVGAESAAKGVRNFTNEVKQASVASANLAKAEGELAVQQRQARKVQLDYQKQAERLRQQRDDESKSIAERIKINNQLGVVLQKQSASELAIANKQLQVADLRIKAEGKTTEALDARAEAETNISDIQERIAGQESEQLANLNSLRKEAADKQKELDQQAIERALTRSRAEIDLFIANQGFKKKSLEEEFDFNKKLADKELANLKLQFDKKKISAKEYEVGKAQIASDFAQKNAELTIANAELEVNAAIEKNQRILDSDRFLSEYQFQLKKEALDTQLKAEQEFQKIRLENGVINEKEYNAELNRINEENRISQDELRIEREEQAKEKALLDLENQKIINEENFLAQVEIEKAQLEIKRQQEVLNAEQTGADISLINSKYAKMQEDIEAAKQNNKVQLASNAFGSLAAIFGAESKAGKAAAIAQTTIDTLQGAIAAYKSLAGIPIVGPVLGGIAAAGATAAGFKAVKQITATKTPTVSKTPSYATGVIGLRGAGDGTSDNIMANLSAGESVINARSTAMFANELSAINQAGGGVGINGASNILNQNAVQNNANNSQLVSMIAEAVSIGAEAGTSKGSRDGIKGLSNDRKIMNDAKF